MGVMLGAFVYIIVESGVLSFLQSAPMVMYILAWGLGFQIKRAIRSGWLFDLQTRRGQGLG
jgi:hypothetical protein